MTVRFRFAADKAAAAIERMARDHPGIDLHTALKACYFADKSHLNAERRPIFGARYRAMKYGPVPVEIYEMMKGEAYWLAELGKDHYPWQLEGFSLVGDRANDPSFPTDVFSDSDREHLAAGLATSRSMNFTHRTRATHGPDWQVADMGYMRYEDMVEEGPERDAILAHIAENGGHVRL
jgi:hypothetical protein